MKISLKTKIAFWWWQKFRFKEPNNKLQKISKVSGSVKSLFIILPYEVKNFRLANHFLQSIISKEKISIISRIIGWNNQNELVDVKFNPLLRLIEEIDYQKNGLLKNDAIDDITNGDFDCVINLEPEGNLTGFQIVGSFNSIPRIGFGHPCSGY